jgi:hypothetical protein
MKMIESVILNLLLIAALPAQQDPAHKEAAAIPITVITEKADQTHANLQALISEFETSETFRAIKKDLPAMIDSLDKLRSDKIYKQLDKQEGRILLSLKQEWNIYNKKMNEWKARLLNTTQEVEAKAGQLTEMKNIWQLTQQEANKVGALKAITNRIKEIMSHRLRMRLLN